MANSIEEQVTRLERELSLLKPGAGIVEMVYIPAGTFQMGANDGDSDEKPVHEVSVAPFFMSQFVITQAQWRVVAALPKVNRDLEGEPWSGLDSQFVGDQLPVVNVSWYSALEFCQRLSKASGRIYGLPSEAQWEYACRAGTTTKYSFGNEITQDKANYGNRERITPSGNYPPNGFGLYDLHGNVWEWCEDTYHDSYNGAPSNGSAWVDPGNSYRRLRGGSWLDDGASCRCANRFRGKPDETRRNIGFRVLCS